jgi:hypothetical protein
MEAFRQGSSKGKVQIGESQIGEHQIGEPKNPRSVPETDLGFFIGQNQSPAAQDCAAGLFSE